MDTPNAVSVFLRNFEWLGILSCVLVMCGLTIPAFLYRGKMGERYSPWNHFVSELGEVGVSRAARIFNGCMVTAGAFFFPFAIGLGVSLQGIWAKLGMFAGIWTAVSILLIGVFPMNDLEQHVNAALSFFNAGMVTIIFFTIEIFAQPDGSMFLPREAGWTGVVVILCYAAFLKSVPRPASGADIADFFQTEKLGRERPRFWIKPILEWIVVLFSTLWYFSTALIIALC
ncbi:MAG: DUF998 domain-containing protein [Anaerolineales bacterium]|nr:DUF998 domain-containing protein [Anaerolineales bacterium]